ncbi:MAG TPA: tRNA lysidine(34) synthetase TilS [Pseudonocardia sp.]
MSGPPTEVAAVRAAVRHAVAGVPPGTPLLVACSGGADSTALAEACARLGDRYPVRAAVVDHGLQAGSAERARATVELLAGLGVPGEVHPVTVTGPGGTEAAARRARYAALRAARPSPGSPVLLGHTMDDQAETVLLGLGRGSGPRSLAGMRRWSDPWLRPLLGVRRSTTRAACAARGIPVWDDPHNADPRFTRVRLRAELLPLLEDVLAGGVVEALARTADQLHEDCAALDDWAERAYRALGAAGGPPGGLAEGPAGGSAEVCVAGAAEGLAGGLAEGPEDLAVDALYGLPAAVRRRVLRRWLAGRGVPELTDSLLRRADDLIGNWHGQGAVALPGGLELARGHGRLVLGSGGRRPPEHGESGSSAAVREAAPVVRR